MAAGGEDALGCPIGCREDTEAFVPGVEAKADLAKLRLKSSERPGSLGF